MNAMYDDENIHTIDQLHTFLQTAEVFELILSCSHAERAEWIYSRLARFRYQLLRKKEKGVVLAYLKRVTGLSDKQIDRHIAAYKKRKKLCGRYKRHSFEATFTLSDAELLAATDDLHAGDHGRLNGGAIQKICRKQLRCGDVQYEHLAKASIATIYRLRQTKRYKEQCQSISKTKKSDVSIGVRMKPDPKGRPGCLRADTVHQGEYEGHKGVYHVNFVDELLQWEVPIAVEEISMGCMKDAVEEGLDLFPFSIWQFHSDPGGEYINEKVHGCLNKMTILQSKSRPGKCTDNALIESKNGAIIRKHMGYSHIPQPFAARINVLYREHFIPYLNFHRPCWFPTIEIDAKGKRKRTYKAKDIMTPYEKFLSLDKPEQYLRPGWTLERLEKMANAKTPNQAKADFNRAKQELKEIIAKAWQEMKPANGE